jgi:hypothetical protein
METVFLHDLGGTGRIFNHQRDSANGDHFLLDGENRFRIGVFPCLPCGLFTLCALEEETSELPSYHEVMPWFAQLKTEFPAFQIIGSTSKADHPVEEVDFTRPTALLIGNETFGLSNSYKEMCDDFCRIPMYGQITSFNVSCAASIMLYEIDRQRRKVREQ